MASAAPGDFFNRKASAQPQVRRIRRFSDVDTDSDFELGDDKPSRPSVASLSFKTETTERVADNAPPGKVPSSKNYEITSDGSILFESGSDEDRSPVSNPAVVPPKPAATAAAPQTAQSKTTPHTPSLFAREGQPQSLAEKLFGNLGGPKMQPTILTESGQNRQPPSQAKPQPPLPQHVQPQEVKESKPVGVKPKTVAAAISKAAPTQPPAQKHVEVAPPTASPKKQQSPLPIVPSQQQTHSPLAATLTAEYQDGLVSEEPSCPPASGDAEHAESDDVASDGGFAEAVLPINKARREAGVPAPKEVATLPAQSEQNWSTTPFQPIRRADVVDSRQGMPPTRGDAADDLLVRARLRLEEKRRVESAAAASSRLGTPNRRTLGASSSGLLQSGGRGDSFSRGPGFYTPAVQSSTALSVSYSYETNRPDSAEIRGMPSTRMSGLHGGGGAGSNLIEAKLRRLTQENTRLQDEITFLNRENQKLRSVTGSADSAENIKMQLTIDLLRKELHAKELDYQSVLRDRDAEKSLLTNQTAELQDQNEGYAATAAQYRTLYEDKVKEIEQLKLQLQKLSQGVADLEHRADADAQQRQSEVTMEREKVEKLLYLIDDLKKQRQHLHELNQGVQIELARVTNEKEQLKRDAESAEARYRQLKGTQEQVVESLQQEVARVKSDMREKERSYAAQLGEEQRINATLQQRVSNALTEGREEAERLRRSIEVIRGEHVKSLEEERARRNLADDKLKKAEADFKSTLAAFKETVTAEYEKKLHQLREEVSVERQSREAAQLDVSRLFDEVARTRESLSYQTSQYQTLSADFAHSEEMRDKAERQCGALTATLDDMMHSDSQQTRRISQLEAALAEMREQLSAFPYSDAAAAEGVRDGGSAGGNSLGAQLQLLSGENERLTGECVRLAGERDALIDENGKIAEELLKWKNEMRAFVSSQLKQAQ